MNTLWDYFWPLFAMGLIAGTVAGTLGYRRGKRLRAMLIGAAITIGATVAWHSYASRGFVASVERMSRQALVYYEMPQIDARLQRGPLTRDLLLTGKADDFQRGELARVLSQVPGVGTARWERKPMAIPMVAEAVFVALLGFSLGLLLAYLIEIRRRNNAEWRW
jgi:hypothetical protein